MEMAYHIEYHAIDSSAIEKQFLNKQLALRVMGTKQVSSPPSIDGGHSPTSSSVRFYHGMVITKEDYTSSLSKKHALHPDEVFLRLKNLGERVCYAYDLFIGDDEVVSYDIEYRMIGTDVWMPWFTVHRI